MQNTAKLHADNAVNTTDFVSAAIDGELDSAQLQQFIKDYQRNDDYQTQWQTYHIIGDTLRLTPVHGSGIAQRVSAQLAQEPTLLAPQRKS
ncbi:MAG: sigma-E factor negative regulatory protein, partial [Sulfuriferula sp.]